MEILLDSVFNNLVITDQATIVGKIYVGFIVTEDGSIVGERVLRNPGYKDLAQQALTIIKRFKWYPGEYKGKKVAAFYTLPITISYR